MKNLGDLLSEVAGEVEDAATNHNSNFSSLHEGYGVIKEEVDEMWDEIKLNNHGNDLRRVEQARRVKKEAMQVAAMAIKMMGYCEMTIIQGTVQ